MDLSDIGVMFSDLVSFVRTTRLQLRSHTLQNPQETKAVLDHKVQSLARELAALQTTKEDKLKVTKLNTDFTACKKDCSALRSDLDRYRCERIEPEEEKLPENVTPSREFLPVEAYKPTQTRAESIQAVARDLVAIQSLMRETASLVETQGTDLVSIETHTDKTVVETGKAGDELKGAAKINNKKWTWYMASGLGTVGGLLGLIAGPVGVPIGAAIGGSAGAALGKAIENHENEGLDEIHFETK